ncbi:MAG: hypothetical protein QOF17_271 [Solirubrobacteraceae bacterium]|jgi:hypothetical protein|nr:hypothetical protein [Solirubrobacteraceae bacterium]
MDPAPFRLDVAPDGTPTLTVTSDDADPVRVRLDDASLRALRDGVDAAAARAATGGQGAVAEFGADGATISVIAAAGGAVRLRVER